MSVKTLAAHLVAALSLVSGSAFADQIVISYSSGKTQTVILDDQIEQVKDIRLDRNGGAVSEKVKELLTGKPGNEAQGARKEQSPAKQNRQPKIQWAPPLSE